MATSENKNTNEKVKLRIPIFAGMAEDDVIIGINGVNWQIPRGEEVEVPEYVAAEYHRSEQAKAAFYKKRSAMAEASKK